MEGGLEWSAFFLLREDAERKLFSPGVFEKAKHVRVLLEEPGEVGEDLDSGRAKVMFDAFDIFALGLGIQTK